MAESATYIVGLVPADPLGSVSPVEIDNHARAIKGAVKRTFPNLTGEVSLSDDAFALVDYVALTNEEETYSYTVAYMTLPNQRDAGGSYRQQSLPIMFQVGASGTFFAPTLFAQGSVSFSSANTSFGVYQIYYPFYGTGVSEHTKSDPYTNPDLSHYASMVITPMAAGVIAVCHEGGTVASRRQEVRLYDTGGIAATAAPFMVMLTLDLGPEL